MSSKVLRVTNLPTEDYPASGLTSHKLAEGERDLLAIPFPARLCLYPYSDEKLVLDFNIDLRNNRVLYVLRFLNFLRFSLKVAKFAKSNNVSIIHIHWVPMLLICLFLPKTIQCILTIHGEDARYLKSGIFRKLSKRSKKIFVIGSYWTNVLKESNLRVEEVPNFSPINRIDSVRKFQDLPSDCSDSRYRTIRLCFVGSEKDHKNLKIFNDLPAEFFDLLNSGKARLDFVGVTREYVRNLGIPENRGITCHGRCSRGETLDILCRSEFLLLPSFTEGNPKVVWEAVALGVVPIISETVTFHGYKHQDYPYKFDPGSSKMFWSAIQRAISSSKKLSLEEYFAASSRDDIRAIYERSYRDERQ